MCDNDLHRVYKRFQTNTCNYPIGNTGQRIFMNNLLPLPIYLEATPSRQWGLTSPIPYNPAVEDRKLIKSDITRFINIDSSQHFGLLADKCPSNMFSIKAYNEKAAKKETLKLPLFPQEGAFIAPKLHSFKRRQGQKDDDATAQDEQYGHTGEEQQEFVFYGEGEGGGPEEIPIFGGNNGDGNTGGNFPPFPQPPPTGPGGTGTPFIFNIQPPPNPIITNPEYSIGEDEINTKTFLTSDRFIKLSGTSVVLKKRYEPNVDEEMAVLRKKQEAPIKGTLVNMAIVKPEKINERLSKIELMMKQLQAKLQELALPTGQFREIRLALAAIRKFVKFDVPEKCVTLQKIVELARFSTAKDVQLSEFDYTVASFEQAVSIAILIYFNEIQDILGASYQFGDYAILLNQQPDLSTYRLKDNLLALDAFYKSLRLHSYVRFPEKFHIYGTTTVARRVKYFEFPELKFAPITLSE